MRTKLIAGLMILAGLSLTAGAATFTAGNPLFDQVADQANGWGQTFTPNAGLISPEGFSVPETVYLLDWRYFRSPSSVPQGGQTYLAVFSALTVAEMTEATLVGVSTNALDMSAFAPGALMIWEFDYLELDANAQYAMMFVQYVGGEITSGIRGEVRMTTGSPYDGGGWIRIGEIANNWDSQFQATYSVSQRQVAGSPYPASGAINVPTEVTLSWEGPEAYEALSYTVYLDPNELNLTAQDAMYYSPAQQELTFTPVPTLDNDMTYYWRVEAVEPNEPTPVVHTGPVWSFSTVTARAVITMHPVNTSVPQGGTAEFSVEAENTTVYQWYKVLPDGNSVPIGEDSPVLTLENAQYDDEGEYYCVVDNERQVPEASNPARLMIRRLIAHWPLDGSLEAIVTKMDENWDGVYIEEGEPATEPVSYVEGADGTPQGAARFNGIRVVRIPNSAQFFNFHPNGLTVTAWVAGPSGRDYRRAVSKTGSYAIGKGQNEQIATLLDGGPWVTAVPGDQSDGWRFAAMTYDPATQERRTYGIYNNGDTFEVLQDVAGIQGTLSSGQTDLLIGGAFEADTQLGFTGSVDDVRIYNYPLSLDEIIEVYREIKDNDVCARFPELDIAGPTGVGPEHRDCRVDLYDLAVLAENWLDSNVVRNVD